MTAVPEIMLNNGRSIPQFGFGVFQIEPGDTAEAVSTALQTGYRHIDTAEMYGNEKEVGEAIAKSGLDRGDVFVTSKLTNDAHLPDDARAAFDLSLEELGFDYLDLFLIHWPLPTRYDGDFVSTWRTLEEFYRDGRARSIGVSNFQPHHLRRLHAEAEVTPAINQIEVHPYLTQDDVRGFCAEHQIAIEGWSPIAQGRVLDDPTHQGDRRADRQDPGPGGAALAHRARRHRLPRSRSRRPGSRRTSPSSTSSCPARTSRRSVRWTRTSGPARTRTRSPGPEPGGGPRGGGRSTRRCPGTRARAPRR